MYPDIYFEPKFGEINKNIEKGTPLHLVVETEDGTIENSVIKREIKVPWNGRTYYDLTTPYGYGGPIITQLTGDRHRLIEAYQKYMEKFVEEEGIVSEFVRFHPIFKNEEGLEEIYQVKSLRPVVQTKIHSEDTVQKEFSKSARRDIRRALRREEVSYRVTQAPENIESFKKIYYDTMKRVGASDFYFFDDAYFASLQEAFNDHLLLVEVFFGDQVVAASLDFFYNGLIHYHLAGTDSEYLKYSPAYVARYAVVEWAEKHQARLLFSGGGTTNDTNDGLYRFKKRFSNTPDLTFKIGTKIWQPDVYQALVEEVFGEEIEEDFFPLYRYKKPEEDVE